MEKAANDFVVFLKQNGMASVFCAIFSVNWQGLPKEDNSIKYLGDNLPLDIIQRMKEYERTCKKKNIGGRQ